jgi:hypothetical protein
MEKKIVRMAKNIVKGAGSVIELSPVQGKYTLRYYSQNRHDAEALRKDWERVGETLSHVITRETSNE